MAVKKKAKRAKKAPVIRVTTKAEMQRLEEERKAKAAKKAKMKRERGLTGKVKRG